MIDAYRKDYPSNFIKYYNTKQITHLLDQQEIYLNNLSNKLKTYENNKSTRNIIKDSCGSVDLFEYCIDPIREINTYK